MPQRRFFTGNTGTSTGPHLHAGLRDRRSGGYINPTEYLSALLVDGAPAIDRFAITSGYGPRTAPTAGASSYHRGVDLGTPLGTAIEVANGQWLRTEDLPGYGRTSFYSWQAPDGRDLKWVLAHGSEDSNPLGVMGTPVVEGGSAAPAPVAAAEPAAAAPDWRAAASDPGRAINPADAAYWQRQDMQEWARAHKGLAAPLLQRAGVDLDFQPINRGALNGNRVGGPPPQPTY